MKFLLTSLILTFSYQTAFAVGFNCKNTYSDENTIQISAENFNADIFANVHLISNNDGLGKLNNLYPVGKFDPSYRPTPKNANFIRYRLILSGGLASSLSLLVPKVISAESFDAVLANAGEGYHGETGYYKLRCNYK